MGSGQTARALRLARASWSILREDLWLLALPGLSALCLAVVAGALFVPAAVFVGSGNKAVFALVAAVAAYPLTFVSVFFQLALVVVVSGRLDGRRTTVRDGLEMAWNRRRAVARWAGVATAVALLLRALRQIPGLGGLAGSIASSILGVAWGAVTFFVVPVIAIEGLTGQRAVKRSAEIFRQRWGLELVGVVSIGGVFVLAALAGGLVAAVVIVAVHTSAAAVAIVVTIAGAGLVFMFLAATALHQTFGLVLYRYATERPLPAGFSQADLERSVKPKKRRGL